MRGAVHGKQIKWASATATALVAADTPEKGEAMLGLQIITAERVYISRETNRFNQYIVFFSLSLKNMWEGGTNDF